MQPLCFHDEDREKSLTVGFCCHCEFIPENNLLLWVGGGGMLLLALMLNRPLLNILNGH